MSKNGRRYLPAVIIVVTLGVGILIGTLISNGVRAARVSAGAPGARALPAPSPVELSNSFADIADAIEPAVVNISTESTVRVGRRFRVPEDSPFSDFFDRFFQFSPDTPLGEFPQRNLGSGVILDKDGYILTNYHVIMNMQGGEDKPVDRIRVQLHGDETTKSYEARVIGTDKPTDLAVIKIEAERALAAAEFGDSDSMRVGDWVLAIGSPFGLDSTVTAGIISAKGRDIEGGPEGQFKRFIQTDAAINPGNSGGPLVNLAGQVVGINTAIATNRGSYDGVGFAIPSNTARKVYNSIVTTGHVSRGAIGISFYPEKNPVKLRMFGAEHGVLVDYVTPDSPAERAGIKRGDVITAVSGKPVQDGDQLVAIVSDTPVGSKLKVELLRDKQPMSVQVEVGDRNAVVGSLRGAPEPGEGEEEPGESASTLGVSVRDLTRRQAEDLADALHLDSPQGVLVAEVQPRSFAADLGILRGDVILALNHQPVESTDDFNRRARRFRSGDDVLFLIARRSGNIFVTRYLADRLP